LKSDLQKAISLVSQKLQHWLEAIVEMIPNIIVAILVFAVFYVIARVAKTILLKVLSRVSNKVAINKLFVTIVKLVLISIGLIISLNVLHLQQTVTSILAGAGIIGLAIGFAFQDISANLISGILLAFRKPIRVGDIISSQGHVGVVESIDMRVTVLKTFQGLHVIIPNKDVFQTPVTNYTKTYERRIDLDVGVSYGENLRRVKELTLNAISKLSFIMPNRELKLLYYAFGDSSINFSLMVWVHYSNEQAFLEAQSELIMTVKETFDNNGITIPFPIRTLDFGIKGGEKLSESVVNVTQRETRPASQDQ
jgi:small conductance mechanosensitive channel